MACPASVKLCICVCIDSLSCGCTLAMALRIQSIPENECVMQHVHTSFAASTACWDLSEKPGLGCTGWQGAEKWQMNGSYICRSKAAVTHWIMPEAASLLLALGIFTTWEQLGGCCLECSAGRLGRSDSAQMPALFDNDMLHGRSAFLRKVIAGPV